MTQDREQQLVISAIGEDRPQLVSQLTAAISDCGANIMDSRMTLLGGEFAVLILVSAPWNAIVKLESALPGLEQELELTLISKRTDVKTPQPRALPYHVEVISVDHPGIVNQIAGFFSEQGVGIQELDTSRYMAAHTAVPMFSIDMTIKIPSDLSINSLRERFFMLCDEQNLDAIIEPIK
ncbi:MAG: glycine cleavage system protein R [Gammaproteobacteria bacterium]|nr:glycine cleavage system protein R [Gammaproteobacteria bacterium]